MRYALANVFFYIANMKKANVKSTMLKIYILSRFVINTCKKLDKEKTLMFTLLALIEEKPRTIRELANLFSVNHSFMSTVISRLEKKDLVKKKVHKDQRYRQIILGAKGKEARELISGQGFKIADILMKNLSDDEIVKLHDLISKLNLDCKEIMTKVGLDYKTLKK